MGPGRGSVCEQEDREASTGSLMASGSAWNVGARLRRLKGNGVGSLSLPQGLQTGGRQALGGEREGNGESPWGSGPSQPSCLWSCLCLLGE